jgi:hypothetical protein
MGVEEDESRDEYVVKLSNMDWWSGSSGRNKKAC